MAGVQFITKEAVLNAYEESVGGAWALFQGKSLRVAGCDSDELGNWLDKFAPAGSVATYTLRLYGEMDAGDIRPNTDYLASFDIKLMDSNGGGVGSLKSRLSDRIEGMLVERFEELEKRLDEKEVEPEFNLNKVIMGYLHDPSKLAMAAGAFRDIIAGVSGMMQPATMAAMGTVNQVHQTPIQEMDGLTPDQEKRFARLSSVLDRLEKRDPQILEHLEKLAVIAETKPDTFKFLITSLNGI